MPSLSEIQRLFADALVDPHRAADSAAIFRGPRARVQGRLAIYRGNFHGNCAKALAGAYPIARKIVGEAFFEGLARAYIRENPSANANLNFYGARFPEFLGDYPPVADLLYLQDVARLEWLAHEAYFAASHAVFDSASLARVPPESYGVLRPRLAAPCSLLESPWPLSQLWAIHQDDYEGPFEVDLDGRPDRVLVHRPGWRVQVISLQTGDWRFLGSLLLGETLGTALEAALVADSFFDSSTALGRWINAQVIVSLE